MNKPCYTEYVRHAIRFYSRYPEKSNFKTVVDEANWRACHDVIEGYTARDKNILTYVYGERDTIGDNVYAMANKHCIHQNIIWDMMKEFEKQVAIKRGLWV